MKMTFRWYGKGNDSVKLSYIKQIPNTEGIVWALHDLAAGEVWPMDRILAVKKQADEYGLNIDVVESVNVHESIKMGIDEREVYIDNYIETINRLGKVGVKVICYNFMPVFDWVRTELFHEMPDGSTALFFDKHTVETIKAHDLFELVSANSNYTMAGWEPERLKELDVVLATYKDIGVDDLFANLKYFLERIGPACKANDIKMAIHPDDPPFSIFNLPRIVTSKENLDRLLKLVDEPYNGLTLCTGSLGSSASNDVVDIIKTYMDRIYFAHIRNVKIYENGDFVETSHRTADGSIDILGVLKAYHEADYQYYIRPDHGRHIWDEVCRPGYGLYDRALGIMYMNGILDTLDSLKKK
ncbi:MAG: mannonate dehydratase [Vallitaleaceae bacterium]|jgi:mannonate dehydratase|nr:mannonate dehydratase [Vallitaleaceae bacterium]